MTTSQPLSDDEANEILGYDLFDLTEIGPEETFPWGKIDIIYRITHGNPVNHPFSKL